MFFTFRNWYKKSVAVRPPLNDVRAGGWPTPGVGRPTPGQAPRTIGSMGVYTGISESGTSAWSPVMQLHYEPHIPKG